MDFKGGSLSNGIINFNNSYLKGNIKLYINVKFNEDDEFNEIYKPLNNIIYVNWFGTKNDGVNDDSYAILNAIKCLHKIGSSLIFENGKTYILGDGLIGSEHTGNSYKYFDIPIVSNAKQDPANIGRNITLTFFRFNYLKIIGNGAKLKSHDNNGDCKHNRILNFLACNNLIVENLVVDGNRQQRKQRISDHGLIGEYTVEELNTYNSLKNILSKNNLWVDYPDLTRDITGGYRSVSNIEIIGGHDILFTNVVSINSMMDGIILVGDKSGVPTNVQFLNCRCLYNSRQGLTISSADYVKVIGGEYSFTGYLNNNLDELGMLPMSGIDIEADAFKSKQILIENTLIDSNRVSGIIYSKDSSNIITTRCTFINKGVNTYNDTGINNEISYNKFINCGCGILQDNLNIHHNLFDFDKSSLTSGFHFDDNDCTENAKNNFKSYFCNNIINVDASNIQKTDIGYIGAFRAHSNIIIKDNTFNNIFASKNNFSFLLQVSNFENNKVYFDINKYPILKDSNKQITLLESNKGIINNNFYNTDKKLNNKIDKTQLPDYIIYNNIIKNNLTNVYKLLIDCSGKIEVKYIDFVYDIKFIYDFSAGNYPIIYFINKNKKIIDNLEILPIICYKYENNLYIKISDNYKLEYTLYLNKYEISSFDNKNILELITDNTIISNLRIMQNGSKYINKNIKNCDLVTFPGNSAMLDNNIIYWVTKDEKLVDALGNIANALKQGTTQQRPTDVKAGFYYFDTTLNKPIWKKDDTSVDWVDATGVKV